MTVYTIGYEGLDIATFMSLLAKQGVDTVVDVRELPLSRKPGFSKRALSQHLNAENLSYIHMVELGCPRPVRNRYRDDGDWNRYTRGFAAHLKMQSAAIVQLSELAKSARCALLCYEADYNFCHRSMVAEAVKDLAGTPVKHLSAAASRTARPEAARPVLAAAGRSS